MPDVTTRWEPELPPARELDLPGRGRLAVREVPGPPGAPVLVLLHGWSVTADLNWYPVFEALGAHYRVISFDHRGHGRGIRSRRPFRLQDCVDDVIAVVDALGIDRFTAVGYSMGGAVAQLLWLQQRRRLDALVLCATGCRFADTVAARAQLGVLRPASWAVRALPRRVAHPLFARAIQVRTRNRALQPWILDEVASGDPRKVIEAGTEVQRFDSRGWATAIGIPTAVIVLDQDTILPTRLQEELVSTLMRPTVLHLAGDHDVCVRDADRFTATLLDACAAVVPR